MAGVAGLMPANFAVFAEMAQEQPELREMFTREIGNSVDNRSGPVRGTSGEALTDEIMDNRNGYDLRNNVQLLRQKPLLLVAAKHDEPLPISLHHELLVRAFQDAGSNQLTEVVLDTDHFFMTKKVALAKVILRWLGEWGFVDPL